MPSAAPPPCLPPSGFPCGHRRRTARLPRPQGIPAGCWRCTGTWSVPVPARRSPPSACGSRTRHRHTSAAVFRPCLLRSGGSAHHSRIRSPRCPRQPPAAVSVHRSCSPPRHNGSCTLPQTRPRHGVSFPGGLMPCRHTLSWSRLGMPSIPAHIISCVLLILKR